MAYTLLSSRCQQEGKSPAPRSASTLLLHCLEEQPPHLPPLRCTTWHPMPPPAGSDTSSSQLDSILGDARISTLSLSRAFHRVPPSSSPAQCPTDHPCQPSHTRQRPEGTWSTSEVTKRASRHPLEPAQGTARDNALCGFPLAHRGVRGLYTARTLSRTPLPRPQVGMLAAHGGWPSSPTHLSSRADATSYGH